MHEEFLGGLIKDGPPKNILAASGCDEFLIEQSLDDAAGVNSADVLNFGNRDGLFVRDDRERFQCSQGETRRRNQALDELLEHFVMFGLGREAKAVGNFANLDSPVGRAIPLDQFVQRLLQLDSIDLRQRLVNRVEADRLIREVNDGFKQG